MHARSPRALLAALAGIAFALAAIPLASTAASTVRSTARPNTKKIASHASKPRGYHPRLGLAPADEYFGRLQMSILGVRSKVKDLGLDADYHPGHDQAVLRNALWVEDAMRDWAKKYPFDRWLPRYAYALEQMYERIPGDTAHKRAVKQVAYLTAYFPQTVYGRVGRAKLAMGIPTPDPLALTAKQTELEHLALIDGKVTPTIPPAPQRSLAPQPSLAPEPSPAPQSSLAPLSSPSASASPLP